MRFMFIGAHYGALRRELRKMGHDCLDVDHWDLFERQGKSREEVVEYIRQKAIDYRPHVYIQWKGWLNRDKMVPPSLAREIRDRVGCVTGYWSVDDPDFLGEWKHCLAEFGAWDFALTCCKASVDEYRRFGVRDPHYFLPGFDTEWPIQDRDAWSSGPLTVEREAADLVIIGHPYWHTAGADLGRAQLAVAAQDAGYSVEIYGPQGDTWITDTRPHFARRGIDTPFLCGDERLEGAYRGWLEHDDVWRALLRGKVVLNNHLRKGGGYNHRYFGYCNDKIFQMIGVGTVMLMDHQPGLEDVIAPDEHYLEYRPSLDWHVCLESAMEQLHRAVGDPELRQSIGLRARAHCLEHHTWGHRARQLVKIVNGHR